MRGISGYFALLMGGLLMMPSSSRALDPSGDADTSFSTDGYAGINVTLRNTDAGGRGMAAGGSQTWVTADSASSSTSTQWRTGRSLPVCRCWMQPMLPETMVSAVSHIIAACCDPSSSINTLRSAEVSK